MKTLIAKLNQEKRGIYVKRWQMYLKSRQNNMDKFSTTINVTRF